MSWKQAVGLLTVIFIIVVLQSLLIGPLFDLHDGFTDDRDISNDYYDGSELIVGYINSWLDMGLVAIFVLIGVSIARIVRRELTRQRDF